MVSPGTRVGHFPASRSPVRARGKLLGDSGWPAATDSYAEGPQRCPFQNVRGRKEPGGGRSGGAGGGPHGGGGQEYRLPAAK